MTINKSQGQTTTMAAVYLPLLLVLSHTLIVHGNLYVCRVTRWGLLRP
jgi:hypothetical protein